MLSFKLRLKDNSNTIYIKLFLYCILVKSFAKQCITYFKFNNHNYKIIKTRLETVAAAKTASSNDQTSYNSHSVHG